MKKEFFSILVILSFLAGGCLKSGDNNNNQVCNYSDVAIVAPAAEVDSVQRYLTSKNIVASPNSSGLFYKVNNQGNGEAIVNLCSNVIVKYTGKLTNDSVFDSTGTNPALFKLGRVITGWQKGLPLISKGGKITLYIPPTLGYGNQDVKDNNGVVVIPANSILIFDIELVGIE